MTCTRVRSHCATGFGSRVRLVRRQFRGALSQWVYRELAILVWLAVVWSPATTRLKPMHLTLLRLIAMTLAYYGAAKLGFAMSFDHGMAGPLWLSSGLAVAMLAVSGLRFWPAILVGAFWASIDAGNPILAAAMLASSHVLEAIIGAGFLRRTGLTAGILRPRDAVAMIVAAILASLPSALGSIVALPAAGMSFSANFVPMWTARWLGNMVGIVLIVPLALGWTSERLPSSWPPKETFLVLAAVAAVTGFFFTHDSTWEWLGLGHMSRTLFVVPPLMWAALRLRPQGAFPALCSSRHHGCVPSPPAIG